MTAEEYIKAYTRGCSNELIAVESRAGKEVISYHEWLTPENALAAVELAREEIYKKLFRISMSSNAMDYVKGVGELMDELKKE
jgi:hypothetical protein